LIPRWDWQKYAYSYRIWGRLLYNSEANPEVWQRHLAHQFGAGSPYVETALANASRILPIITTAHAASVGNNTYWPEVYYNQSMVDPTHYGSYGDSPAPRAFGNVSPLDPQLFSRMNDFAKEPLASNRSGKYSPIQLSANGQSYSGTIPAAYTDSQYPLEYYFEVKQDAQHAGLYPGFSPERNNQPYFVVRRA
jgi:hypothetical protein